jgi:8-oxo-dGTP pyrophosphatase MutT (NUDIX family)
MNALHEDALAVLSGWAPPSAEAEATRQRFLDFVRPDPGTVWREHTGSHVTASTLVVDASAERVLLCLHGRIKRWVQLGGHCEPGDATLRAAALREATEESGIAGLTIDDRPLHVDVHPVTCSLGVPTRHLDVRYLVRAPAGSEPVISDESDDLRWWPVDALPADTDTVVTMVGLAQQSPGSRIVG